MNSLSGVQKAFEKAKVKGCWPKIARENLGAAVVSAWAVCVLQQRC